jgi:hypothetical protein
LLTSRFPLLDLEGSLVAGQSPLLKAIQNLGNKYPHVRAQAVAAIASVLAQGGTHHSEEVRVAVRCLADHVADPDEPTAVKASGCLVMIGAEAAPAFPELAHGCLDKRPAVSMEAATALVKLVKLDVRTRRKALEVLPVLVSGLPKLNPDVVGQLASIIRSLEGEAEPIIEQLVEEHLVAMPQGTLERLQEKVTGAYRKRRKLCMELLGKIGPFASPALPALKEFLHSDDPTVQNEARSCIIRIRRS